MYIRNNNEIHILHRTILISTVVEYSLRTINPLSSSYFIYYIFLRKNIQHRSRKFIETTCRNSLRLIIRVLKGLICVFDSKNYKNVYIFIYFIINKIYKFILNTKPTEEVF